MKAGGLAAERTSLAWSRTALSYAACALLLARLAADSSAFAAIGVGVIGVLVTAALLAVRGVRGHQLPIAALTAASVLTALCALAFIVA